MKNKTAYLFIVICLFALCFICSCSAEVEIENVNNSQHNNQQSNTPQTNNEPSNTQQPGYTDPIIINPEINFNSREIIELKEEIKVIDEKEYTLKHCVNLLSSNTYYYEYYVMYYEGENLRRCSYYSRYPSSCKVLIPYSEFANWIEDEQESLTKQYYSSKVDVFYYDNGLVSDSYQYNHIDVNAWTTNYDYIYHTHYLENGKTSIVETTSIDPLHVASSYYNYSYLYYDSGSVFRISYWLNDRTRASREYYESGQLKEEASYYPDGPEGKNNIHIYRENGSELIYIHYNSDRTVDTMTVYYDSGKVEYSYWDSRGKLSHSDELENTSTDTAYSDAEIKEWIETYLANIE